jgi:hypothetical protein
MWNGTLSKISWSRQGLQQVIDHSSITIQSAIHPLKERESERMNTSCGNVLKDKASLLRYLLFV